MLGGSVFAERAIVDSIAAAESCELCVTTRFAVCKPTEVARAGDLVKSVGSNTLGASGGSEGRFQS